MKAHGPILSGSTAGAPAQAGAQQNIAAGRVRQRRELFAADGSGKKKSATLLVMLLEIPHAILVKYLESLPSRPSET
jgi:hypothetical protein